MYIAVAGLKLLSKIGNGVSKLPRYSETREKLSNWDETAEDFERKENEPSKLE